MTLASLEEVATLDDDGNIDGLQFDGRERRIQEWLDGKEDEEYKALFRKLRMRAKNKRNYKRIVSTKEGRERVRESGRRSKAKNRERRNEGEKQRRRKEREESPIELACKVCRKTWILPFGVRPSSVCSERCKRAFDAMVRKGVSVRGKSTNQVENLGQGSTSD